MALHSFRFSRCSIVEEEFVVEAATEQEAREKIMDGNYKEITDSTWVGWYDDQCTLVESEELEPLYSMIVEYAMNQEEKSHA